MDLKKGTKEFQKKYVEETKYILEKLEKERELSKTHKKLIKKIKEKLK